jgi:hypothetical protein
LFVEKCFCGEWQRVAHADGSKAIFRPAILFSIPFEYFHIFNHKIVTQCLQLLCFCLPIILFVELRISIENNFLANNDSRTLIMRELFSGILCGKIMLQFCIARILAIGA